MYNFVVEYTPWLLSALTIQVNIWAGKNHKFTWLLGLVNCVFWIIWSVAIEAWGLMPLNIVLLFVFTNNHLKWNKKPPVERLQQLGVS